MIKEKTQKGQALSSRAQACSLAAVCVVWVYLAVVQSAAVAVSVAGAVAVAVYAGVYLWTAATLWSTPRTLTAEEFAFQTDYLRYVPTSYDLIGQEILINQVTRQFAYN